MLKRLAKILAEAGTASRRASEKLIFDGKVTVDGETILVPQTLVNPKIHSICVEGELLKPKEEKVYFLLNKPKGYISTNKRPLKNSKLVIDLFEKENKRLFTVGRLDKDSSGLLIVTNDGTFANQVIHPSSNISKEYLAVTQEEITFENLKMITKGMRLERVWIKPLKVKKMSRSKVRVTIGEGKKREVRHLLAHAGLTVLELCRIRIGPLHLGNLPIGSYRRLQPHEISTLIQDPKLEFAETVFQES